MRCLFSETSCHMPELALERPRLCSLLVTGGIARVFLMISRCSHQPDQFQTINRLPRNVNYSWSTWVSQVSLRRPGHGGNLRAQQRKLGGASHAVSVPWRPQFAHPPWQSLHRRIPAKTNTRSQDGMTRGGSCTGTEHVCMYACMYICGNVCM